MAVKTIKSLPKAEMIWEHITSRSGREYTVTSDGIRRKYFLYENLGRLGFAMLTQAPTPTGFTEFILEHERSGRH